MDGMYIHIHWLHKSINQSTAISLNDFRVRSNSCIATPKTRVYNTPQRWQAFDLPNAAKQLGAQHVTAIAFEHAHTTMQQYRTTDCIFESPAFS
jgi:hypothetical protein